MSPALTRQELYELAWSMPMTKLAKHLKMSDRGASKLCARQGVPVPPRGYWTKRAAGKAVKPTPLPPKPPPKSTRVPPSTRVSKTDELLQEQTRALQARATARLRRLPEPANPPTKEYTLSLSHWGWRVCHGEQGRSFSLDDEPWEAYPIHESIYTRGLVGSPPAFAGHEILVDLWVAPPGREVSFSNKDRAHVGCLQVNERGMLECEIVLWEGSASRFLQVLMSGRSVDVVLSTEPGDERQELVVSYDLHVAEGD